MTEKSMIEVNDGQKISAVYHEADSDKWVFFCHGYGSNKEGSYEMRAERAVEKGYNAVRFDFRGNGESDGEFIDQDLSSRIKDLKTVIDFYSPRKIFLFGMSFGGKVVFHSAEDLDVEAVIGKSPVTYNSIMSKFEKVVEEKGSYTHFADKTIDERLFQDFRDYSFESVTENLQVPVAIFHGGSDSTVKFESSARAIENFETDSMLYKLEGEEHSMTEEGDKKILEMMFAWLENI